MAERFRIVVFHRAVGFVHDSIPVSVAAIERLGAKSGVTVDVTDDPAELVARLDGCAVVVFLQTSGDAIPEPTHRRALERFVESGGGFFGVHAASALADDVHESWPWLHDLIGACFKGHTRTGSEPAVVRVEDPDSPAARGLVDAEVRRDEWYGFHENPRAHVHVVATVDESTYDASSGAMGADHPIIWWHDVGRGRAVYNALGHAAETWQDEAFLESVLGGIELAAGRGYSPQLTP